MRYKIIPFKWKPLSRKQQFVFKWWRLDKYKDYDALICDGSIRAGKTISMALSYIDWATETFDNVNIGIAGKTIQSCRRNVITPLKQMMIGRKYRVKDNQSRNVVEIYNPRTGHTVDLYIFGGGDEGSQDLVQGITLAGFFFDEVALMAESFVNQATGRCSVEGAKFWFNCNPDSPVHWFKRDWIEKKEEKNAVHIHFTMDDNLSLSEAVKERYRRMYTGIFFKRFILGLWVMAEGVIYDMFNEEKHIRPAPFTKQQADRLIVSVDYGIQNPMTFGKYGVKNKGFEKVLDKDKKEVLQPINHYHLYETFYHSGRATGRQKTDSAYADDLVNFIGEDNSRIKYVIVDPSATSFIAELRSRNIRVIPARNEVIDGISMVMIHLAKERFTMDKSCTEDEAEFYAYIWDEKAILRGEEKPVKENDHCMDRNRYAIFTDIKLNTNRVIFSGRGAMDDGKVQTVGTGSRI